MLLRFLTLLACAWLASPSGAGAQPAAPVDDRPFRYEPPNVDRVYPEPAPNERDGGHGTPGDAVDGGVADADAGVPEGGAESAEGGARDGGPGAQADGGPRDAGPRPAEPAATREEGGAPSPAPSPPETALAPSPEPDEPLGQETASAQPSPPAAEGDAPLAAPVYGATGTVERREPGHKELSVQQARDLPGAFGDPLRMVEVLPGVLPVSSGLPYFYARGSPPANQGYRYDGLLLPQLFHVAIGPQVLHPRMFGGMDYYGAVAPANFGRRSGALVDVAPSPHAYALRGELELRLLDVNGFVEAPVLGGNLQVAGRYGYPGLMVRAFVDDIQLDYWDGQLRYELPLDDDNRLQLVWIGSYDNAKGLPIGTGPAETNSVFLHFHRVALRAIHDTPKGGELGISLRFGYDDSALGTALYSTAYSVGPRFWYTQPLGDGHRLNVGADMLGSTGDVEDFGGTLGGLDGQLQVDLPTIGEAAARNQGGAYGEVLLRTSDDTRLRAGARVDLWHVQDVINVGVDPRLRFSWAATQTTEVQVAAGMAHQPAVFLLPLPGLSEVALSDTLTRTYQAEAGIRQQLPWNIELELTPFFSYQQNLLLPELVVDGRIGEDPPLVDARAAGVELFAEGDVNDRLVFVAGYTLGFAKAFSPPRILGTFSPDFDVRHVVNLTARYDFPSGFNLGLRFGARSGRMIEQQNPRYAQRLPWFSRLDFRVGYAWQGRWAKMNAYFEWLNATLQGEYLDADCFFGQCVAEQAPAIFAPNLGIRATFGGPARTSRSLEGTPPAGVQGPGLQ